MRVFLYGMAKLVTIQLVLYIKKDTKKRRFYSDTKTTSDLKVATKACSGGTLYLRVFVFKMQELN